MKLAARRVEYRIDRQYAMVMKQLERTLEIPIEIIRDSMRRLVKPLTIVGPIWFEDYHRGVFTQYALSPNGGEGVQAYQSWRIRLGDQFISPRWWKNSLRDRNDS